MISIQPLHLTGAATLVFRATKVLQAAPAGELGCSAIQKDASLPRRASVIMRCCIPFAALFLVAAQPPAKDGGKKDRENLQGEWAVVSWEGKAFSLDKEQAKNSNLVIKDDAWQPTVDGEKMIKMNVKLDPSKTPKEIDLTLTEKFSGVSPPDFTMKGIYKIEGDTLTVCRTTNPDFDRPKDFKAGENWVLIVAKRVEKK